MLSPMRTTFVDQLSLVAMKFLLLLLPLINAQFMIDDFMSGFIDSPGVEVFAANVSDWDYDFGVQIGTMFSLERDVHVGAIKKNVGNAGGAKVLLRTTCACSSDTNVYPYWNLQWDGVDGSTAVKTDTKLGDFSNVCPAYADPFVLLNIKDPDNCGALSIKFYTPTPHVVAVDFPFVMNMGTCNPYSGMMVYRLSDYVSDGADMSDIRAITVEFDGRIQDVDAIDFTIEQYGVCCCQINNDCNDGDGSTVDTCRPDCGCDNIANISLSVGDYVWHDVDGNGLQDDGLTGFENVTVRLILDADGDCQIDYTERTPLATTTTDVNGTYLFTMLDTGSYIVDVTDDYGILTAYDLTTTEPLCFTTSETYLKADFGYVGTGTLGDYVWNDKNNDQVQDDNEHGFKWVDVELWEDVGADCTADNLLETVTTDNKGFYEFIRVPPGNYVIRIAATNPNLAGYGVTTVDSYCIAGFPELGSILTNDFGYVLLGSIGDTVWHDEDEDGKEDGGENGLDGVFIRLVTTADCVLDASDTVDVPDEETAGGGLYLFDDLYPGTYIVVPDATSVLSDYALTTANDPLCVTIKEGEEYLDADFGYVNFASVGNRVWHDANMDTVQDGGEVSISAATVVLISDFNGNCQMDGADAVLGNIVTSGSGDNYQFTDVSPNIAYIVFSTVAALAANYQPTTPEIHCVPVLSPGEVYVTADFGYVELGSIGDLVWNDQDASQDVNGGELGIPGVTVSVYEDFDADCVIDSIGIPPETIVGTDTTDGSGLYLIDDLPPGNYLVTVTDISDVLRLDENVYIPTTADPFCLFLPAGGTPRDADFGFQKQGEIGNFVWFDADEDTFQDGGIETGIDGVYLYLIGDTDGDCVKDVGEEVLQIQDTSGGGNYLFEGLAAGDYIVQVIDNYWVLHGFELTTSNEPYCYNLAVGESHLQADFGYVTIGSVGDFVWNDKNDDSVQNDGPLTGFAGVGVDLISSNVACANLGVLETTVTGSNGRYLFLHVDPGQYLVSVNDSNGVLAGYGPTTTDPHCFTTSTASLNYWDADFGYVRLGSIGDKVWDDLDGEGDQDEIGTGILGVTVNLIIDDGDCIAQAAEISSQLTDVTDVDGFYGFSDLRPGSYIVSVTDPSGYLLTTFNNPICYNLAEGQDYEDADFGYVQESSIGDFVWDDTNGDGVQDFGEVGFDLISLELHEDLNQNCYVDLGEPLVDSTSTNSVGFYSFTALYPGDYVVSVTDNLDSLDAYFQTGGSQPECRTLPAGTADVTADFGYQRRDASIGDYLWYDVNGNTFGFEDGEVGVPYVEVLLYRDVGVIGTLEAGTDILLDTTLTDWPGFYLFEYLAADNYLVTVDTTGVLNGYTLTGGTDPHSVTLFDGEEYLAADFGYFIDCPNPCEIVKGPVCLQNQDNPSVYTLACVMLDELDAPGMGRYKDAKFHGTYGFSCTCEYPDFVPEVPPVALPVTNAPSMIPEDAVTSPPTVSPTVAPTWIPTQAVGDPTSDPILGQLPFPPPTPFGGCVTDDADNPGFVFRCYIDEGNNVRKASVNLLDLQVAASSLFVPGASRDLFGYTITFDCECEPDCPTASTGNINAMVVDPLSGYKGGALEIYVAIPNKFTETEFTFINNFDHTNLPVASCANTSDIGNCLYWETTDEVFNGNCWDVYKVSVPYDVLSTSYNLSSSPPGTVTIDGMLHSSSIQHNGLDLRGRPKTFTSRRSHRWQINLPSDIDVHDEDNRIYQEPAFFFEMIGPQTLTMDLPWDEQWSRLTAVGSAAIQTSVQWPYELASASASFVKVTGDLDIVVVVDSFAGTLCPDLGIVEYNDTQWRSSADSNLITNGIYVPFECLQGFSLLLYSDDPVSGCDFDGFITMTADVQCQDTYVSNCPLDERADTMETSFELNLAEVCTIAAAYDTLTATVEAFEHVNMMCSSQTSDVIDSLHQPVNFSPDTIYFLVGVFSAEPLQKVLINTISATLDCPDLTMFNLASSSAKTFLDCDSSSALAAGPNTCDNALDVGGIDFVVDNEGVGAWIQINFVTTVEIQHINFQSLSVATHWNSVRMEFSDDSNQLLNLTDVDTPQSIVLDTVQTTSVRFTVESVHAGGSGVDGGAQLIEIFGRPVGPEIIYDYTTGWANEINGSPISGSITDTGHSPNCGAWTEPETSLFEFTINIDTFYTPLSSTCSLSFDATMDVFYALITRSDGRT